MTRRNPALIDVSHSDNEIFIIIERTPEVVSLARQLVEAYFPDVRPSRFSPDKDRLILWDHTHIVFDYTSFHLTYNIQDQTEIAAALLALANGWPVGDIWAIREDWTTNNELRLPEKPEFIKPIKPKDSLGRPLGEAKLGILDVVMQPLLEELLQKEGRYQEINGCRLPPGHPTLRAIPIGLNQVHLRYVMFAYGFTRNGVPGAIEPLGRTPPEPEEDEDLDDGPPREPELVIWIKQLLKGRGHDNGFDELDRFDYTVNNVAQVRPAMLSLGLSLEHASKVERAYSRRRSDLLKQRQDLTPNDLLPSHIRKLLREELKAVRNPPENQMTVSRFLREHTAERFMKFRDLYPLAKKSGLMRPGETRDDFLGLVRKFIIKYRDKEIPGGGRIYLELAFGDKVAIEIPGGPLSKRRVGMIRIGRSPSTD